MQSQSSARNIFSNMTINVNCVNQSSGSILATKSKCLCMCVCARVCACVRVLVGVW